jgi:hypothetical protein
VIALMNPEETVASTVLEQLRASNDYFATEFAAHLEEEERTLFPLLERYAPGGDDLVARLRQEHAEIRRRREELGNCIEVAAELEDSFPKAILRDLLMYSWELWTLLDSHAHGETRAVHDCVARSARGETLSTCA